MAGGARARAPQGSKRRPRRWLRRSVWLLLVLPVGLGAFAGLVLFFYFFASVPLPSEIGVAPTVVLDHAGQEIGTLSPQEQREDVALSELPEHVMQAVLAAEDADFYRHPGLSLPGIFRAAVTNVASGQVRQGGSTISQQYVKNVTAERQRTMLRKIREAALAVKLERELSKDEILAAYLNSVYFGRGAYGIEAAARAYYGKAAAALEVGEAAQLAGIIVAPSVLDPARSPEHAERRYRYVLDRLRANGWLEPEQAGRLAANRPEPLPPHQLRLRRAPFFLELVERELAARLGDAAVHRGLTVHTTLNLGVQSAAESAFAEGFADVEPTGALVAVDPGTGGIRALVAGRDTEEVNLAAAARRQPGSTFKPFALAAWIEQGRSPESYFDAPAQLTLETPGGPWEVRNYGSAGYPAMSLAEATWRSVNTVYAQVAMTVGPDSVADLGARAGIERELPAVPSIALGSAEVTPLELASAYNTFAAGGEQRPPFAVLAVERDGELLFEAPIRSERAFSEQVAWTVTETLRGVIERGTGRAAAIGRPAAGKTGTTTNHADAWFAGYTPQLTAVVWMGNRDSNTAMAGQPTGGGLPARVWGAFMQAALDGVPAREFPTPAGSLEIVRPSPTPTSPDCPEGQTPRPEPAAETADAETGEGAQQPTTCVPEEPEDGDEPAADGAEGEDADEDGGDGGDGDEDGGDGDEDGDEDGGDGGDGAGGDESDGDDGDGDEDAGGDADSEQAAGEAAGEKPEETGAPT